MGWSEGREGLVTGPSPHRLQRTTRAATGEQDLHVDEEKFPIVRKMGLHATGQYSVSKLVDIANNEWGPATVQTEGNKNLRTARYKIFTNPSLLWRVRVRWKVYEGKHKPMITVEEFNHVQRIQQITAKFQTRHKTCLIGEFLRCGECGLLYHY